ncbi:MAG TPA: hypothetical protein VFZ65_18125 [Planctomycetota bacterium]|nr:hypothetical protein [Planctomycetota bacterium]
MRKRGREREGTATARFILRLASPLGSLLAPLGVDRERFLALLEARLIEDLGRGRKAKEEGSQSMFNGGLILTLSMQFLFGLVLAAAVAMVEQPLVSLTLVFGVMTMFVTLTLVSEHSATLLETKDLAILGPLPVDGRTILAARVAHTLLFFVLLVGSLGFAPLIAGTVRFGPAFAPAFLLASMLGTATCIALALVVLATAVRVIGTQHLRTGLLMLQVAGTVFSMLSYQMIGLLAHVPTDWLVSPDSPWPWILPPVHDATIVLRLIAWEPAPPLGQPLLAVAVPGAMLVCLAILAPTFQSRMLSMSASSVAGRPPRRRWLRDRLLGNAEARAGYDFMAAMMARERLFRMRAYPVVAVAWVFAAWIVVRGLSRSGDATPAMACAALYLVGASAPQFAILIRYSDDWAARWLFRTAPLRSPAMFCGGAVLSLFLRLVIPIAALTVAVVLAVGGFAVAPDAGFALLVLIAMSLLALIREQRRVPFTRKFSTSEFSGASFHLLGYLMLAGMLAGAHAVLRTSETAFTVAGLTLVAVVVLLARAFANSLRARQRVDLDWGEERIGRGA